MERSSGERREAEGRGDLAGEGKGKGDALRSASF